MAKLPIFATERLILREVTEEDAAAYEKKFVEREIWELTRDQWREFKFQQT